MKSMQINELRVEQLINLIRNYELTPAQKQALARKTPSFSSFAGLGGSLRASRVDAEELKYSNHFTLVADDAFAVTIICNFSMFSSGVIEFRV